jgi:hypothetical protein
MSIQDMYSATRICAAYARQNGVEISEASSIKTMVVKERLTCPDITVSKVGNPDQTTSSQLGNFENTSR